MNLGPAARGFLALLLSAPALQGNNDLKMTYLFSNVCALRGSTVDISSTFEYPYNQEHRYTTIRNTTWFTKEDRNQPVELLGDADYEGRVEHSCGEKRYIGSRVYITCTLKIKSLRESDSAEYKFRIATDQPEWEYTGIPGVKVSVTDLQVKVSLHPGDPRYLYSECHSMCDLPYTYYTWFKNGEPATSYKYDGFYMNPEDSYSCAVQGYERLHSPSVYAPKTPSVTVSPSGEIEEGSSVTLSCSTDANPEAKYSWFKVLYSSFSNMNQGQQLVFNAIQSSNSGQYYCRANNELGAKTVSIAIDVKYGPKHTSVFSSRSGEIEEGSSVTLSCSSDANPAAEYSWFRNNQRLLWRPSEHYTFTSVRIEDRGTYRCKAENTFGHQNSSALFINVQYAPKTPSMTVSPSGEIEEGSSVTLSCSTDANPEAKYSWFKEHEDSAVESGQNYSITNITSEHRGNYFCQARNSVGSRNSTLLFVNVTDSSSSSTSSPPSSSSTLITAAAVGTVAVALLLLVFLWLRRRACGKAHGNGGRPHTTGESHHSAVYSNVSTLTDHLDSVVRREPIEEQDELQYAAVHFSSRLAGRHVQSDQTEQALYSVLNLNKPNAVPEDRDQTKTGEASELYSLVRKHPRV